MKRCAVLYLRVSTEEQATNGVSLDAQNERLVAYCQAHNLFPAETLIDDGISGAKPLFTRPGGGRAVQLLSGKHIKHIVALKLDRLFRDAADALTQTRAWDRSGVALHVVDMGGQSLNTASAMGRMFLTMTAAFAELERNLIAERTSAALQHMKQNRLVYGLVPFGLRAENGKLVEDTDEQLVLANMVRWRGEGWSYRQIASELNSRSQPTKTMKRWHPSTIWYLLVKTHGLEQPTRI